MDKPLYKAITNSNDLHCISGPGNGFGYHAHTLNPDLTCNSLEEAERAAKVAFIAYRAGYRQAQKDMRKSMGLIES